MKIALCYICVTNGRKTTDLAARFCSTYYKFSPGVPHDVIVICNGGPIKTEQALLFKAMNARFWPRVNDGGWDISAYVDAARGPCAEHDMMLCLGESNYFHREGWLRRMAEVQEHSGPGMYGPYGSYVVRAHLQTTAFATTPDLLRRFPTRVHDKKTRYEFEHGERSFWRWLAYTWGKPVCLVTWDGIWNPREWRDPENILWRGDQSNCLMWSNHTDRYRDADATRKYNWEKSADRPFK